MRGLNEKGELNELQAKFFAPTKEKEKLYDLKSDPFETINLVNDPNYASVLTKMKSYDDDWNSKNHDFGFDEINWKNSPPPNAPKIIEWLEKEKPEILEQMKQGIEPGFGKIMREYKAHQKQTKK